MLKKLTLLHSNDLHGDFMTEQIDDKLVGGVSMLSGYVDKVRREEDHVIYAIAGDMFRGSLIDSEYQGISTIEIMNMLAPDIVTIGNHEVDYGLSHLLFIEKCASFPIINANMYLTLNHTRLFESHKIFRIGGRKVLFIGILTEDVLAQTRQERIIGSLVNVEDAAQEVSKICNAYQTEDIDFTVLLTHIGIESDKKLAEMLDPRNGVDIIIGGHSHTLLSEPVIVNGIPIVQAASGTDQIGRFDITVDTDTNSIHSYEWKLIPITPENCPRNEALEEIILKFHKETEEKYSRILTRFADIYTHPQRNRETMLGKIFADAFKKTLDLDLVLVGSGSIRDPKLGPIVAYKDLLKIFPFSDAIHRIYMTGSQLKHAIRFICRDEAFTGDHTEYYQFSEGFYAEYSVEDHELLMLSMNGKPVEDDQIFRVGMQDYHFQNILYFLDLPPEAVEANGRSKVVATKAMDVVEEYFLDHPYIIGPEEDRLVIYGWGHA